MKNPDYSSVIRARRNELGMNQAALAEALGVSRNAVAGWETGHSRPDLGTVPLLCETLQMPLEAFFGTQKPRGAEEDRLVRLFFSLGEADRDALMWQIRGLAAARKRQREEAESARPVVRMPRYVRVYESDLDAAAGFSPALSEAQGRMIYLLEDAETSAADEVITVTGRSMEPSFFEGDRVLVQHTDAVRPGEIGIFLVEDEGYIKEYQPDGLHSHNPEYATMVFDEGQSVRCAGRVIGKLKAEQIPGREELQLIEEAERAGKQEEHEDE